VYNYVLFVGIFWNEVHYMHSDQAAGSPLLLACECCILCMICAYKCTYMYAPKMPHIAQLLLLLWRKFRMDTTM